MSGKIEDELRKPDAEVRNRSLINLPIEKLYKESITPQEVHWVALQNLNDVLIGNYLSVILFSLSTTFLGMSFTSPDETAKFFCRIICLILIITSGVLHLVLVLLKIRRWKKHAIRRGDFE